jgi:hypothetical protein
MRKRFHTETSAGGAHGQDRPTLSVFDDNATLTGDVAAVRQMLPGLGGESSSSSAKRISSSSMACFSSGVSQSGQTISESSSTS